MRRYCGIFYRLTAWIAIQAVLFGQLPAGSVSADLELRPLRQDSLRIQQRGDSSQGRREVRAGLEDQDPLDGLASLEPFAVIISDMDETATVDRDSPISDRTAALLIQYLRLGGKWIWLSSRDEENIAERGRVEEIRAAVGGDAADRYQVYGRSGIGHPAVQILVTRRSGLLNPEALLRAAAQVTGLDRPTRPPYSGVSSGNPNHIVHEYGDLAVFIPKENSPPGTMAVYAYRPLYERLVGEKTAQGISLKEAEKQAKREVDPKRKELRPLLLASGHIPEGVSLGYAGSTSLNVEVSGKGDFIREVILKDPAYAGMRIVALDDEARPGYSGYTVFTTEDPRLIPIAVDREKADPDLPSRVVRSGRQKVEAVNRLLEIENAKRQAVERLGSWSAVQEAIRARPTGQTPAEALLDLGEAGQEEGRLGDAVRLEEIPEPDVLLPAGNASAPILISFDAGVASQFKASGGGNKLLYPLGPDREPTGWIAKKQALALGLDPVVIVGPPEREGDRIRQAYDVRSPRRLTYVVQREALGTAHAAYHAARAITGANRQRPVLLVSGDQPLLGYVLREMLEHVRRTGADLLVSASEFDNPAGYGRVVTRKGTDQVVGIIEQDVVDAMKPRQRRWGYGPRQLAAMRYGNVSLYYVRSADLLFELLEEITPTPPKNEYYVTDIVERAAQRGLRVGLFKVDPAYQPQLTTLANVPEVERALAAIRESFAGMEDEVAPAEAEQVLRLLREQFVGGAAFDPAGTTVERISHGRTNTVYRITGPGGQRVIGFRMFGIWRFPQLDRNHFRFEAKQEAALAAGLLPEGWKRLSFLDRIGGPSKFTVDEGGSHWRFMPFTEGTVIQAIDEIPQERRLAAVERFGRVLVQFRRMLETQVEGEFEDSLPKFQETAYHLGHYDRVLAGAPGVEPSLSEPGKLDPISIKTDPEDNRLTGRDAHGDFAARNAAFQEKVARYRQVIEPALGQLKRVVTHGDPKVNNVFWEVDQSGEWQPLAMGDLDTLQLGHETLDLADALRVLSFLGGEDADPENLAILRDVVEAMTRGWLDAIEATYGPEERSRLEPYTYLSVAAIYFTLAVRFYDSFLTGDSYFGRNERYEKTVPDPGRYLRLAEIQMAQAEAFMREFKDKPGMASLAALVGAGMDEIRAKRAGRFEVRIRRADLPDLEDVARRTGEVPHHYLRYELIEPVSGVPLVSMNFGFSRDRPEHLIIGGVERNSQQADWVDQSGLDYQLLIWALTHTIHPEVKAIHHRYTDYPGNRELDGRIRSFGRGIFEGGQKEHFDLPQRLLTEEEQDESVYYMPTYRLNLPRATGAAWRAGQLPTGELAPRVVQFALTAPIEAGMEEVGGPAIGVVPGLGLEAGRPPVVAEVLPITGSVERLPTPVALPAAASIPADVRSVLGELAKARVQSNLYGMIFAEPVGLAVGVAVPGQDEAGRPLPRRFVVSNESQEQTLNDLGVDPAEMVRAWDPAYGGSIDRAIEAARSDLESRGAIVLDETVIRGLTPTFAGEFLSRIQSLSALLTPRDYSPESAAKTAEKVYDLFV